MDFPSFKKVLFFYDPVIGSTDASAKVTSDNGAVTTSAVKFVTSTSTRFLLSGLATIATYALL